VTQAMLAHRMCTQAELFTAVALQQ
jgi:hypothetical protein